MFRTVVPLAPIAVEKVGPQDTTQVTTQVATQVTTQVAILAFCKEPRSKAEIMEHCGYKNKEFYTNPPSSFDGKRTTSNDDSR